MAAIAGLRGTGDWGTDERPKNFRETILWREPNGSAPITALMGKMASEKTTDPEFAWWEEEQGIYRITETTGLAANAGSTALNASGGGLYNFVAGDLLLVEKADQTSYDNEIVEVSSISSDIAGVIIRGAAGTTVAAIAANAILTKIGSVYSEGSAAPSASTRNPSKYYNYAQIFKTKYELTNTAAETKARTGDPLANDKKRKMFDHAQMLELSTLFGRRSETTGANGKPKRTFGGLRSFITTNVTVFATTPTTTTFLDAVYPLFNYQSRAGDERIMFCGNPVLNALNQMALNHGSSRIIHEGTVKVYGMNLQKWVLPQGILYVKTHPLLNIHPRYSKSAFILDPTSIKWRYLRDTFFKDKSQDNDEDTTEGYWLTEGGIEVQHEKTMGYLGNFTYP